MPSLSALLGIGAATLFSVASATKYAPADNFQGSSFFDHFDFVTEEKTNGFVKYVDRTTAEQKRYIRYENGDAIFGVDYTSHLNSRDGGDIGRESVRLEGKTDYNKGLFVLDIKHMPGGICGTWPAFWALGREPWPVKGEIDIIEGVNGNSANTLVLHTNTQCKVNGNGQTGSVMSTDCALDSAGTSGCGVSDRRSTSFGTGFNANNGGYYVTEWQAEAIKIWFFPRGSAPASLLTSEPDTAEFGEPAASFQGSGCDIEKRFMDQRFIFTNTFCGDWGGNAYAQSGCPMYSGLDGMASCKKFVAENPSAFKDAFWRVSSFKTYNKRAIVSSSSVAPSSTPHATSSSVPVSSSVPATSSSVPATTSSVHVSSSSVQTPSSSVVVSSSSVQSSSSVAQSSSVGSSSAASSSVASSSVASSSVASSSVASSSVASSSVASSSAVSSSAASSSAASSSVVQSSIVPTSVASSSVYPTSTPVISSSSVQGATSSTVSSSSAHDVSSSAVHDSSSTVSASASETPYSSSVIISSSASETPYPHSIPASSSYPASSDVSSSSIVVSSDVSSVYPTGSSSIGHSSASSSAYPDSSSIDCSSSTPVYPTLMPSYSAYPQNQAYSYASASSKASLMASEYPAASSKVSVYGNGYEAYPTASSKAYPTASSNVPDYSNGYKPYPTASSASASSVKSSSAHNDYPGLPSFTPLYSAYSADNTKTADSYKTATAYEIAYVDVCSTGYTTITTKVTATQTPAPHQTTDAYYAPPGFTVTTKYCAQGCGSGPATVTVIVPYQPASSAPGVPAKPSDTPNKPADNTPSTPYTPNQPGKPSVPEYSTTKVPATTIVTLSKVPVPNNQYPATQPGAASPSASSVKTPDSGSNKGYGGDKPAYPSAPAPVGGEKVYPTGSAPVEKPVQPTTVQPSAGKPVYPTAIGGQGSNITISYGTAVNSKPTQTGYKTPEFTGAASGLRVGGVVAGLGALFAVLMM